MTTHMREKESKSLRKNAFKWKHILAIIGIMFILIGVALGILNIQGIVQGHWSDILSLVLFPATGLIIGLFAWLYTIDSSRHESFPSLPIEETVVTQSDSIFRFNLPLNVSSEFYGRVLERKTLLNRTRNGGSTSIVGQRRIGKTWLISYLKLKATESGILGPGFVVGYLDATSAQCETVTGFIIEALEALKISTRHFDSSQIKLNKLAEAVVDLQAQNLKPVLCIDEFEGFAKHPEFNLGFLEGLRAMTQGGLVLITASKEPLVDVVIDILGEHAKTSPFFNVFQQITLKPFEEKEAEKFVEVKGIQAEFTDEERGNLLEHLVEYDLAGKKQWFPQHLQLGGQMLLDDKNAAKDDPTYYRPSDPKYWLDFSKRLSEQYQNEKVR